jgi:hypothetical protein
MYVTVCIPERLLPFRLSPFVTTRKKMCVSYEEDKCYVFFQNTKKNRMAKWKCEDTPT